MCIKYIIKELFSTYITDKVFYKIYIYIFYHIYMELKTQWQKRIRRDLTEEKSKCTMKIEIFVSK